MSTKKDMRRADLSRPLVSFVMRNANSSFSHSLSRPSRERRWGRHQQHVRKHDANGCYVHEKQICRMVWWNWAVGVADLTARRASVVFAVQNWLGEGKDRSSASQPAIFSVGMARESNAPSHDSIVWMLNIREIVLALVVVRCLYDIPGDVRLIKVDLPSYVPPTCKRPWPSYRNWSTSCCARSLRECVDKRRICV